jgi:FkbM family methyltransferase
MLSNSLLHNLKKGIAHRLKAKGSRSFGSLSIGWLRLKYLKHLPPGKMYEQTLFGKPLLFNAPQELIHGLNEIFLEEIYKQSLPNNARVLDCGANIGLSIIYIKRICPTAKITAFEPDKGNYELLARNMQTFELKDVEIREEAIWKEDTTVEFSTHQGMASHIEQQSETGTTSIKAVRLRTLLNEPIDFLKLDIEGAEYEVLMDCQEKLANVQRIFIEYHGQFSTAKQLQEIFDLLTKSGFQYYIKEAAPIFETPFYRASSMKHPYQVQLNIFGFRD